MGFRRAYLTLHVRVINSNCCNEQALKECVSILYRSLKLLLKNLFKVLVLSTSNLQCDLVLKWAISRAFDFTVHTVLVHGTTAYELNKTFL